MAGNPFLSKIKLPNGVIYEIKDEVARATAAGGIFFRGVTTTVITDNATTSQYVIGSDTITASNGDFVIYGNKEFVYHVPANGTGTWHELGDNTVLGDLAYADTASGSFTPEGSVTAPTFTGSSSDLTITVTNSNSGQYKPAGTISTPTFTGTSTTFTGSFTPEGSVSVSTAGTSNKTAAVSPASSGTKTYTPGGTISKPNVQLATNGAGTTTSINNPTSKQVITAVSVSAPASSAPNNNIAYWAYDSSNEMLTLKYLTYTQDSSIDTTSVTVKTGDGSYELDADPTFTGTAVRLVTGNIAVPSSYTASFTGTAGDVSVSGEPNGTISQPTFDGTKVQISGTTVANGSISAPTFSGTAGTITVSPPNS